MHELDYLSDLSLSVRITDNRLWRWQLQHGLLCIRVGELSSTDYGAYSMCSVLLCKKKNNYNNSKEHPYSTAEVRKTFLSLTLIFLRRSIFLLRSVTLIVRNSLSFISGSKCNIIFSFHKSYPPWTLLSHTQDLLHAYTLNCSPFLLSFPFFVFSLFHLYIHARRQWPMPL